MAPKQKNLPVPLDEPPTASSSSSSASSSSEEHEQEQEASSEQLSSDNEKEQNPSPPPKTLTQTTEPDSESEYETESESDTIPAMVQPVASKPKAQAQAQKPKAQPSATPVKSGSKRPTDSASETESKRAKKKSSSASASDEKTTKEEEKKEEEKKEEEKKTPRRWSEDEELTILKGLLDLSSKTKQDPLKITNAAFHDFMTKLPDWEEVSRDQLKVKLRGLKRKFDGTVAKEKNGESLSFSKPHDQKVFELSKKVWGTKPLEVVEKPKSNGSVAKSPKKKETGSGSGKNAASAKKSKPESKKETKAQVLPVLNESEMDIDHGVYDNSVGLLSREFSRYREVVQLNEDEVKRGLVMIGESKRAELEQKWKELRSAEMKLFAERSLLIAEQTKLVVEALQSSDGYDSQ